MADVPAERILVFELAGQPYALPVSAVSGVAPCGPIRPVPRAPAAVLGLSEWRGNVLIVFDLPRLLRCGVRDDPGCLVRLAPPLQQTALYLPTGVRMASGSLPTDAAAGPSEPGLSGQTDAEPIVATSTSADGRAVRWIVPANLLRALQGELRERV
jgi:hypothetical protein